MNSKYSPQGLSDSFGMLIGNHHQEEFQAQALKSQISPPVTPGLSPERTFSCTALNCGKRFTSKQSLKSHMAIHADETFKPFNCTICGINY